MRVCEYVGVCVSVWVSVWVSVGVGYIGVWVFVCVCEYVGVCVGRRVCRCRF